MKNCSDDFKLSSNDLDQDLAQIENRLSIQIKPIAQWFKHIDCLCNEVDATVSDILDPDRDSAKEQLNKTLYQQCPRSTNQPLISDKHRCERLQHTIDQLQDLALEAQKEIYKLKLQLQKDAPATHLKLF